MFLVAPLCFEPPLKKNLHVSSFMFLDPFYVFGLVLCFWFLSYTVSPPCTFLDLSLCSWISSDLFATLLCPPTFPYVLAPPPLSPRIFLLLFYVPKFFFMFSELPYILGPAVTNAPYDLGPTCLFWHIWPTCLFLDSTYVLEPSLCSWFLLYSLGLSFVFLVPPLCSCSLLYVLGLSFMFLVPFLS